MPGKTAVPAKAVALTSIAAAAGQLCRLVLAQARKEGLDWWPGVLVSKRFRAINSSEPDLLVFVGTPAVLDRLDLPARNAGDRALPLDDGLGEEAGP